MITTIRCRASDALKPHPYCWLDGEHSVEAGEVILAYQDDADWAQRLRELNPDGAPRRAWRSRRRIYPEDSR